MNYPNTTDLESGLIDQIIDIEKANDPSLNLEQLTETLCKTDYYVLKARLIKLTEATATESHETLLEAPMTVQSVDRDAMARIQLEALGYANDEKVFLRFFYPKWHPKCKADKGAKSEFNFPAIPWKSIDRLQSDGRGCYFVVNGQGQKNENVLKGKAVFYEHDDLPRELQLDLWKTLGLPVPTIQIDTGGKSIHSYWVFDQPIQIADWKTLQTDLLDFSEGDRLIKNESRVMRLAGALHIGEGGNNQSVIIANSGTHYSFDDLRSIVPIQNGLTAVSTKSKAPKPLRLATETVSIAVESSNSSIPSLLEIRAALVYVSPDCGYGDWLDIGMALHSQDINLLSEWDSWSSGSKDKPSEKYKEGFCSKKWETFGSGSINIYKLFQIAKNQNTGYQAPKAIEADNNIASGFDEALESLQAKENLKAELHDACFDDESIHGSEYYFKGIWAKVEGGILLPLMRNRYVALAMNIDAKLLGLLPSGVKVRHPLAKYSSETLALFNFTSGDSNSGKKVLNKMIRQTLGRVGKQMDSERKKKQTIIINEFKAREGSESGSDSDTPKLNPKLVGVPPKSQLSDASPEAVQRLIASNQHFALLAPYTDVKVLPALGMCMSYSEGRTFLNRWNLTDEKSSYSPSLNSLRDGEGEDLDRVTGDQYYDIKDGQLSMTIHIQPPFLNNLYRMERPSKKTPDAAVDGLGARLNVVLIEKDLSFDDEIDVMDEADHDIVSDESYKLNQLNGDLKLGIEHIQLHLIENPVIIWDRDAKELYCSMWRPWWKLMDKKHQRGLANYWGKLDSNLIATAGSKACQRWVNSWIAGNADFKNLAPTELKITVADLEVAMIQCKLYAAHRIYTESLLCDSEIKDELRQSETRTIKQDEDAILKRFSDPALLKVWVEDQITMGRNTLRLICYSGINKVSRARMKTHNIDVREAVRAVLETLQPK